MSIYTDIIRAYLADPIAAKRIALPACVPSLEGAALFDIVEFCRTNAVASGTQILREFVGTAHGQLLADLGHGPLQHSQPADGQDHFLLSREWRTVRMVALERDGGRCNCCGRTAADGITINVDHIKPRARYPELALTPDNLQVLCNECNQGKGNRYQTDWRKENAEPLAETSVLHKPANQRSTGRSP